jgi:hypothetical protein
VDYHGLIIIDYQLATINQLSRDLVGGVPSPFEKYESVGMIIPNIRRKNVPNHQPDCLGIIVATINQLIIV